MIDTLPILLDGKNTAFGGRIIDASVNIEFSAASSFSVSIVSETGLYAITEASLRAGGDPMVLKIGDKEFKIFPVSYTVENSEGIKTLRVEFLDSSVKHLDKKFVLLKGTHITADNINNPDVDMSWIVAVGTPYEVYTSGPTEVFRPVTSRVDADGYLQDGYGLFSSETATYYSLLELLNKLGAIIDPSEKDRLKEILRALYSKEYYGQAGLGFVSGTREQDFVGTVREVLASWGDEVGVIFYWDPEAEKIKFFEPNTVATEGDVSEAVARMGECSCKSSSVTKSLQNNVLGGNIVVASTDIIDQTSDGGGRVGSSEFYLLDPFESVFLQPYEETDGMEGLHIKAREMIDDPLTSGLNDLMKAASAGEDFYLGYVLHSLAEDYNKFMGQGYTRKSPVNAAITRLYGDALQVWAKGVGEGANLIEMSHDSEVQAVLDGIRSSDNNFAKDNSPVLVFAVENKIKVDDASADWKRRAKDSLDKLLSNTSEETVFQKLKALAENYNRWYFSTTLITNMKFSFRNYEKTATWEFHGIEVEATPWATLRTVQYKAWEDKPWDDYTTEAIPLKGEARDWRRELPPRGEVRTDAKYINENDGSSITTTGEELDGDESFPLVGHSGPNILEFAKSYGVNKTVATAWSNLEKIFSESAIGHATLRHSYSNLQTLRESYGIDENRDYGLIIIDGYAGTKGLAASFDLSLPAPVIKEVPKSSNEAFTKNTYWSDRTPLYCRGKYDYDAKLTGMPDFLKPAASVEAATGIYGETTSFSYTLNSNSSGDKSTDSEGRDFDLYAKGVFVPAQSDKFVKNNIDFQNLSFIELLSTVGTVPQDALSLVGIRSAAANWAKLLSVNDNASQYSQQITFVGIPESIPSIAEGLEGLSISVDENGVSTQVSVGSRKIKREIFEKRQRTINEAKYRSERSRMTLIPNGRFSTRFLAGTQL